MAWREDTDMPERARVCFRCGSNKLKRKDFFVRVKFFDNIRSFDAWRDFSAKTWYKDVVYEDLEKYFPYYDTLQWEGLFTDLY